jgi:hypothetical protein
MNALRWLTIFSGVMFSLCAVVPLLFLPWSLSHYSGEPEDTWALALSAVVLGLIAGLCFVGARLIGRRSGN